MTSQQYPAVMYTIHMSRTGVYYVNMFVWPAVILAFLTAFMFLVPPDAGERVHIGENSNPLKPVWLIQTNEFSPDLVRQPKTGDYCQATDVCTLWGNFYELL